jgi:hypothetical protein
MSASPLIRTPQLQGGTLYTFSSAARDLSRTLNSDNLRFVFSKFVLLDIPDFKALDPDTFGTYDNYMQFNTIDGVIQNQTYSSDDNVNWALGMQNYVLNLENLILNDTGYDDTLNRSVAERVFFKWLKETGAMRFREATDAEKSAALVTAGTAKYVEEDEKLTGTERYKRVVKYVGDIDLVNNVQKAGDAYTELYIYVPTEVGSTPVVLFDALSDNNYQPDLRIEGSTEFINGRNSATVHPEGLDIRAAYDYDDPLSGSASGGYTDPDANWMSQTTPPTEFNSYFTEPTAFTSVANRDIVKYREDYNLAPSGKYVAYRRNNLDGISVDFNPQDYAGIQTNATISTIAEFNSTPEAKNFQFNVVLLYYDIYDPSNTSTKATNLYGVLLTDNIVDTPTGGFINRFQKYKPNDLTKENGNSYGLKVNLKFDPSVVAGGVSNIINDYNTFSMGLFSDTLALMQDAVNGFEDNRNALEELQLQVDSLENRSFALNSIADLQQEIRLLRTQLENSQLAFASSQSLLDLIANNSDNIQSIINGKLSINLQYNTDVLMAGPGILLDKSTPNKVIVTQQTQEYTLPPVFNASGVEITSTAPLDLNSSNIIAKAALRPFTNMIRIPTLNVAISNIKIILDDAVFKFRTGQTVRIVFPVNTNFGGQNILFYTDTNNRFGFGSGNYNIATVLGTQLISENPVLELICTNENNYTFVVDILR